jgi:hypothetical protein
MGYRGSLLDLYGAVQNGMDPTTAYSVYQNLSSEHQATIGQNQERLGSLIDMITQGAQQGMTAEQMQAVTQATAPQLAQRPRVTGALESLYPQSQAPAGPMDPGKMYGMQQAQQSTSPLYAGPTPEEQMAQIQLQQTVQQAQDAPKWSALTMDLAETVKAHPDMVSQAVATAQMKYADLMASDPDRFSSIVSNILGSTQIGQQPTTGA